MKLENLYLGDVKPLRPQVMSLFADAFISFFSRNRDSFSIIDRTVRTTMAALSQSIEVSKLEQGLHETPKTILALLAMAAHQAIDLPVWRRQKIHVEIVDWKITRSISELRPEDSNQLLRIRGIVTEVSTLSVIVREGKVTCTKCGKEFEQSGKCGECQSTHFVLTDKSPISEFEQRIELRQIHNDARIACTLAGDLVDSMQLGQIVDITGVVAIEQPLDRRLSFTMDVHSVRLLKDERNGYVGSFISSEHCSLIESLSKNPLIFPLLVNSILVKSISNPVARAVLLLLLFSTPSAPVHIWVSRKIGGLGEYCDLAPHCILFDETSSDKLSCRRKKTEFLAGAFVQANEGLLVLDDIDRFISSQIVFLEILDTGHERVDPFRTVATTFSSLVIGSSQKIDDNVKDKFTVQLEIDGDEKPMRRPTQRTFERWHDSHLPLSERLLGGDESVAPDDLVRYIAYGRQFVAPRWSPAVRARLREVATTTRQLKRIKALAECRVRTELRDNVREADIEEVSELLLSCSGVEERRRGKDRRSSRQKVVNDFMVEFARVAKYKEDGCLSIDEMKEIADMVQYSSRFPSFDQFLEALTTNSLILQSGPKSYRPGGTAL
jgi:DNA replicative helicase MCM subunit Mcm2 (Cdc46/Mcm family)